ncbi:SCO7613 C-terminal domain-containing membrane protein [Solicola gregarius]|uniref:DUF2157 domain-containing protein n=1 Tax=Solicola gregarius TaxID=2908642 RepID=A0AA46YL45_9ACTN|nr:hypothetical protein [Solicola gregarius]UYM05249.1 hypothetical protein L0C25_22485 [Solicola gregarius]
MSRFADPNSCPSCGRPAYGDQRCASCGVLLLGPTPQLLLGVLADADRILDGLRAEADGWRRAHVAAPAASIMGPAPQARTATRKRSSWSTGSTLLALGALCLVVAAFVFVSVSWGALGLMGRTAVLAVVTLAVAAAAAAVTVRQLRASAEALWAVALALLALDYAGAREYGLLGLDTWSGDVTILVLGCLTGIAGTAICGFAGRRGDLELAVGEAGAGIGLTLAVVGGAGVSPFELTWTALLLVVPTLVVASGLHVGGLRYAGACAVGVAGLLHATAVIGAAADALAYKTLFGLVVEYGEVQTLVASAMTVALGAGAYAVVRRRDVELAGLAAGATTAIAATQLLVLAYAPVLDDVELGQVVGSVLAVGLAVVGVAARGRWLRGLRVTALLAALPMAYLAIAWCAAASASIAGSLSPVWSAGGWAVVRPLDTGMGPAWLAGVVIGSLGLVVAAIAHYTDLQVVTRVRRPLLSVAGGLVAVGLLSSMALASTPVALTATAVVAVGAIVAGIANRAHWQAVGLAIVVAGAPIALVSQAASLCTWALVAFAAMGIAMRAGATPVRPAAVAIGVGFGQLVAVGTADLGGLDGRTLHLVLVVGVVGVLVAAQYLPAADVRLAAESVAGGFAVVAVVVGFGLASGWQSAMLTVLGAALVGISLLRPDRRALRVAGSALLGLAYVVRLAASDIGVVEAYTLPFGVVLLLVGYARMRTAPGLRTRTALLPGLSLVLLPSLPLVLADPASVRGLLLGFAAATTLAGGTWLRWQAPFAIGSAIVAVVVVRHLGPYAEAVPRWSLIAAAGTALLLVGVTWESRVRDARAVSSYVTTMR